MTLSPHIYIIAGEASGDTIGARLIDTLKARYGDSLALSGIGGELMEKTGLTSLFPMHELSIMGFIEILPHIFSLKRRIKQTVADIIEKQPDILVTIDSPGFNNRVIAQLKAQGFNAPVVHYVAPTVWAYKPKRAEKAAKLYDHLLTILPFEPPYFEKHGLATTFVGHPSAWEWKDKLEGDDFRYHHEIDFDAHVVGMMPGSRVNEINWHMPIFMEAIDQLSDVVENIVVIIPTRESVAKLIRSHIAGWDVPCHLVIGDEEKKLAFAACDLALAKSGTVSLEVALANIPAITAFKATHISMWIAKQMVKVKFVNLINIIAKREIVPEYIQEDCEANMLSEALGMVLTDEEMREEMRVNYKAVTKTLLISRDTSPSERAVDVIDSYLKGNAP